MPVKSGGYYSTDMGKTWNKCEGEPENLISSRFSWSYNFSSDRVKPDVFYGYSDGKFYVSTDGAVSFEQKISNLPVYNRSFVRAVPYMEGNVWVALGFDGIYTSSDYGTTMTKLPDVTRAYMIAFGKPATGRINPTAFLYGEVKGETGIFMSVDMGNSWVRINDDEHMIGDEPTCIGADRQEFGVVYIGTNGRGFSYGRPNSNLNIEGAEITISDNEKVEDKIKTKDDKVRVFIDGNIISFDSEPEFSSDRVMVPVRKIVETIGAEVDWLENSQTAIIKYSDIDICMPINANWFFVNNEKHYTDVSSYLKNGRVYIPLRSIFEKLGCTVSWDNDNRCVWIENKGKIK